MSVGLKWSSWGSGGVLEAILGVSLARAACSRPRPPETRRRRVRLGWIRADAYFGRRATPWRRFRRFVDFSTLASGRAGAERTRAAEPAPSEALRARTLRDASETRPSGLDPGGRVLWPMSDALEASTWGLGGVFRAIFGLSWDGAGAEPCSPSRGRAGRVEDASVWARSGRTRTLADERRLGCVSVGSGGVYFGDFS